MPPQTRYVIDSNIFIEAKQRYYGFEVCPGFWDALVWQHQQGAIVSIDRVKKELEDFGDDLSNWSCNTMPGDCFKVTDEEEVTIAYKAAIAWAVGQPQFTPEAKAEFATDDIADAWVIAYAKAFGATVVTHEKPSPDVKRRIPIPNVCIALNVPFIDTFEMLRALATRFSWQPTASAPAALTEAPGKQAG